MAGAFAGAERRPKPGFALVEHPDMPGEIGEVPVDLLGFWADLGWQLTDSPHNPPTPEVAEDPNAPEGADPAPQEA